MRRSIATVLGVGLAAAALFSGACSENNDIGPGDLPPPGLCSVMDFNAEPAAGLHPYVPEDGGTKCPIYGDAEATCSCADYADAGFPSGVFDYEKTEVCTATNNNCSQNQGPCYTKLVYAWPDCARARRNIEAGFGTGGK